VQGTSIGERLIRLRRRLPDASWDELCRVLSAAPDDTNVHELLAILPPTTNPDLFAELRALLLACRHAASWKALGLMLEVAGEIVERQDRAHRAELIWTGPQASSHLRRLEQVLYDLIQEAKSRILLVTFAAAHIKHLNLALLKAMERRVLVRLVLEFELTSEGQLSFDALRAFDAQVQDSAEIYFWPSEYRERNVLGRTGKLHAKCAVIDKSAVISSANLTDDAFSRNMELGVHINNHATAEEIWEHFEALIKRGVLRAAL
jgi:phosphatidylserine/phosphatidylglycerophosphate/cardiolipin synthase-like enzyme